MEIGTENFKSDFRYDIEMFREAARNPDGENNRLLWLSRKYGTECFRERDVYLTPSQAHNSWLYYANSRSETPLAYAVHIKEARDGRIKGDIIELDYRAHARSVEKDALHVATVTAVYADGAELHLPYGEWDGQRERFFHEHGELKSLHREPEDESALRQILEEIRGVREKEARPAVFKVRAGYAEKPSIKQQIAEGRQQLSHSRAAMPERAAAKPQGLEV
jgi:hypothetical protein